MIRRCLFMALLSLAAPRLALACALPFGVTGNGVTDDTAAINAAITALGPSGGTLCLPAGTYLIDPDPLTGMVRLASNLDLVLSRGAVLKAKPNALQAYVIVSVANVHDVSITGFGVIQGDRATHTGTLGEWGHGIAILSSGPVIVRDVTVTDCWGDGIYISDNGNPSLYSHDVSIEGITSTNNRRNNLSAVNWSDGRIVHSLFTWAHGTAPSAGIDLEPNVSTQQIRGISFLGNDLYGNQGHGFQAVTAHGQVRASVIVANVSAGNGGAGFVVGGMTQTVFTGNLAVSNAGGN